MLTAINPANGNIIRTYDENSTQEVVDKVKAAHQAFLTWRETTFPQRVEKLRNTSKLLINRKEEYAVLMATEMGKPIRDGWAEIEKCAWVCDYYADNALTRLAARNHRDGCPQKLYIFQTPRCDYGRYALELSLLAGVSVCCPGLNGRQCRGAQTRLECAGLFAGD